MLGFQMSTENKEPAASTSSAQPEDVKRETQTTEEEPTTLCELTAKIIDEAEDPLMKVYREKDDIDTDSDESDIEIKPAALEEEVVEEDDKTRRYGPTVKGELTLDDLPPVEKLKISVPQDHLEQVGEVFSFVERLVVVEATKSEPVLNLDTVLFLEDGRAIGLIFDVVGPVVKPYYVLRFNNTEEIEEEHLEKGVKIFCAPTHEDYTFFVFEKQIKEMMKKQGSDASWEYDIEPPEHELEYSDDEQEREAKKGRKAKRQADGKPVKRESSRPPTRREFFTPRGYFHPQRPGPHASHAAHPPTGPPQGYMPPYAVPTPYTNPYAQPPPMYHPGIPPPGYNPWAHPSMTLPPMNWPVPQPLPQTLPPSLVRNNNNQLCYKYLGQQ